jgi:mRNA interferase MazF
MHRGEIWQINLEPIVGAEIKKTRPAVIISSDAVGILPLKIIVPITGWKDRYAQYPWMVSLMPDAGNGLEKHSAADGFQVRSVDQQRLVKCLGELPEGMVELIVAAVKLCIES